MRTYTTIALVLLLVSFGTPTLVAAQGAGANGTVCVLPEDCISRNCVPQGPGEDKRCEGNSGGSVPGGGVTLMNPLNSGTNLESFLGSIMDFIIRIGTIVVILMIVFVGYKFVVARGKPGDIEEAKKMLLWTVIGALILLGAKAISSGILATVQSLGG